MENNVVSEPLYTADQTKALGLFLRQRKPAEIAEAVGVATRTVQKWITQFDWKTLRDDAPIELMMRQRIAYLMWVDQKLESQERELKMLLEQQFKRDEAEQRRNRPAGRNDGEQKRGRKPNKTKNDVSHITKEMLDEYREKTFFEYQKEIHGHKQNDEINEVRFYLKSRQIGLTFYFAFEAFEDAVLTGDNQVFISASKKQSYIFKNYIRKFALEIGEVDLKGMDDIELSNGANLIGMRWSGSPVLRIWIITRAVCRCNRSSAPLTFRHLPPWPMKPTRNGKARTSTILISATRH